MAGDLATATIVLYDVVDSTRIRTDIGDGAAERLLRDLDRKAAESMGLAAATGIAIALEDQHWMKVVRRAWEPIESQICGIAWAPLPAAEHYAGLLDQRLSDRSTAQRAFALATDAHCRFGAPGFENYAKAVRTGEGPPYASSG